jgi:hypothetical protein
LCRLSKRVREVLAVLCFVVQVSTLIYVVTNRTMLTAAFPSMFLLGLVAIATIVTSFALKKCAKVFVLWNNA